MSVDAGAVGVLAATAWSALGAALYLALAFFVLRLAVRWAREALGETPPEGVAAAAPPAPKAPARG